MIGPPQGGMRRISRELLAKLGASTIVKIGATLFLLDLLLPDPIPFLDEFLILAATVLISRWARARETSPKHVGRGRTSRRSMGESVKDLSSSENGDQRTDDADHPA